MSANKALGRLPQPPPYYQPLIQIIAGGISIEFPGRHSERSCTGSYPLFGHSCTVPWCRPSVAHVFCHSTAWLCPPHLAACSPPLFARTHPGLPPRASSMLSPWGPGVHIIHKSCHSISGATTLHKTMRGLQSYEGPSSGSQGPRHVTSLRGRVQW